MIVQTIEISLSKGRAPDLLAHVAESGREIEMIPDVELFADDYTAEIDTVKPDGTFTITNCIINADGHIIAPIIEQAVAVKGLCHYIIKIFNDDVVIYSACGSLWVDDHLITDDMLESIAEVNGYRFPQDFATLDDIPTSEDFINDNTIELEKTWSSNKINDVINDKALRIYSTNERVVGIWTSGKPLYQRTITGTLHIATSNRNWYNIQDISNVENVVPVFGSYIINPGDGQQFPIPTNTGVNVGQSVSALYNVNESRLRFCLDGLATGYADYSVTIQYTKTTD